MVKKKRREPLLKIDRQLDIKLLFLTNVVEEDDLPLRDVGAVAWTLQAFSQDYDLASDSTDVAFVKIIHEWRDLQFKVDSERQIVEKLFMAILFTLKLFARNLQT